MTKWWSNNELFTDEENRLVAALFRAHSDCVFRPNCSTAALQQAAGGSRSLTQSYIAALATLGEMHGPVEEAYDYLKPGRDGFWLDALMANRDGKIPGWGNSFIKGRIDDAFLPVDQTLEALFPRNYNRIREITELLHTNGKNVFPNPACYTATVALILGLPRHLSPMLFVQARLEAWSAVFHGVITELQKPKETKEAA